MDTLSQPTPLIINIIPNLKQSFLNNKIDLIDIEVVVGLQKTPWFPFGHVTNLTTLKFLLIYGTHYFN